MRRDGLAMRVTATYVSCGLWPVLCASAFVASSGEEELELGRPEESPLSH